MSASTPQRRPTERFSDRTEYYARYRPRYSEALISFLEGALDLRPEHVIADVGSGTGILSQRFLENDNEVYGVEPNAAMRGVAEAMLASYERFHSVAAAAEATGLAERSIDLVTAGQAFHWFDRPAARQEFARILRGQRYVAIIYNDWDVDGSALETAYHKMLEAHGSDYNAVRKENVLVPDVLRAFFAGGYEKATMENDHFYDFESLRGRVLSTSYSPLPGHPQYEPLIDSLRALFAAFQEEGKVRFPYETTVYWGRV